jgi:hypothetical protein
LETQVASIGKTCTRSFLTWGWKQLPQSSASRPESQQMLIAAWSSYGWLETLRTWRLKQMWIRWTCSIANFLPRFIMKTAKQRHSVANISWEIVSEREYLPYSGPWKGGNTKTVVIAPAAFHAIKPPHICPVILVKVSA